MCNNLNAEWGCLENGWRSNALVNFSQTILFHCEKKLKTKFVGGRSHCGQVLCVSRDGTMAGADLGHSSNYSNELQQISIGQAEESAYASVCLACKTLKSVVRKVFWRVAINSESVDPKCWAKADRRVPFQREEAMNDTKGKSVNIPILCGCCSHREVLRKAALLKGGLRLQSHVASWRFVWRNPEEFSFLSISVCLFFHEWGSLGAARKSGLWRAPERVGPWKWFGQRKGFIPL